MDEQNVATASGEELPRPRGRRRFQRTGGRRQESSTASSASGQAINMGELRELVSLIAAHGFTEFELEQEGFRVRLRREANAAGGAAPPVAPLPAPSPPTSSTAPPPAEKQEEKGASDEAALHLITSPIVGTFYRAPSPTAEPYVKVGSHVEGEDRDSAKVPARKEIENAEQRGANIVPDALELLFVDARRRDVRAEAINGDQRQREHDPLAQIGHVYHVANGVDEPLHATSPSGTWLKMAL